MPDAATPSAWGAVSWHVALAADDEAVPIPTLHVVLHMLRRLADPRSPRHCANWHDEGLNRDRIAARRGRSQLGFEVAVLGNLYEILKAKLRKRRASAA